ncbi:alpha/beta hydrolase [Treponema brennaborense]|nr:alpha/beta hydrolase [Treponema brennaborense]
MKTAVKGIVIAVCSVAVIAVIGLAAASSYFFTFALDPASDKDVFTDDEPAVLIAEDESAAALPAEEWLMSEGENVFITAKDGLQLHGYFIAAKVPSDRYALAVHGYKMSAAAMAQYARHYYERGWNVLVPDQRSHGLSEGRYIGMGAPERYDMIEWIRYLTEKDSAARVVLHGVSMGAATVMLTTGEPLPANVRAAVEDCGYSSIDAEFTYQLKQSFNLPRFPLIPVTSLVTKLRAGYFFGEGDCVRAVGRSVTPTLFIHGDADTFVPFAMLDQVYEAASCEKEKLVVPGAAHADSVDDAPDLYWAAVDSFLSKYVP